MLREKPSLSQERFIEKRCIRPAAKLGDRDRTQIRLLPCPGLLTQSKFNEREEFAYVFIIIRSLDWTMLKLSHLRKGMGKVIEGIKAFLEGGARLGEI